MVSPHSNRTVTRQTTCFHCKQNVGPVQERGDGSLNLVGRREGSEKWVCSEGRANSIADRLDVGTERKRSVKDDTKNFVFCLSY